MSSMKAVVENMLHNEVEFYLIGGVKILGEILEAKEDHFEVDGWKGAMAYTYASIASFPLDKKNFNR